jgi:hypothetical protein
MVTRCIDSYLASSSHKLEAETNNSTVELAFEKLDSWLLKKMKQTTQLLSWLLKS